MIDSPYQKDFNFLEIKTALLDQERPFPAGLIYFFSDITREDLQKLEDVWPEVETQRRRGLLEDMETLAESDTLLFFDHVAVMCLEDEDPVARATAIRLLWQSHKEYLVPRLIKLLTEDPEAIVRAAAATSLGNFVYLGEVDEIKQSTYDQVVETLIKAYLSSDEMLVRRRALEALGYATHPEVQGFIERAYNTNDEEWLQSALFTMGRTYNKRWVDAVLRMFDHPDSLVRYEAVRAAGELEAEEARLPIFDLLEEGMTDDDLYFAAIWSLTKIGGRGVRELIEVSLDEADDPDEIQFLEEALENLNFSEQINLFDMMYIEGEDPEDWLDDEEGYEKI
jgi:HEAT repeat protein